MYFVVDFADPMVLSPVTRQIEDGEEEVIQVRRLQVTKETVTDRRVAQPRPSVPVDPENVRTIESFRSLAPRAWLTPLSRAVLSVSDPPPSPDDH